MSKAGKGDSVDTGTVGSQHPVPEKIPHLSSPPSAAGAPSSGNGHTSHNVVAGNGNSTVGGITLGVPGSTHPFPPAGSPVKESSFLHRETSASDIDNATTTTTTTAASTGATGPVGQGQTESIPIRR